MQAKTQSVTSRTSKIEQLSPGELFAQQPHIQELIKQIVVSNDDHIEEMIANAGRLRELRNHFEASGLRPGVTWHEWARHHTEFKDKNLRGLLRRLVDAKSRAEQETILRLYWGKESARQAEWRANKKLNEEKKVRNEARRASARRKIRAWAINADIREVEKAWLHVQRVFLTFRNPSEPTTTTTKKGKQS